jgi:hypothetical protein
MYAVNSTDKDKILQVPSVTLHKFDNKLESQNVSLEADINIQSRRDNNGKGNRSPSDDKPDACSQHDTLVSSLSDNYLEKPDGPIYNNKDYSDTPNSNFVQPNLSKNISNIRQPEPVFSINSDNTNTRLSQLKSSLRLEHLNREEREHVERLINYHADLFRLPNESLTFTNKIAHRISTTDEYSIHTKQYRFPPIHKDEINKQIKELIDNKVITSSTSPYNSPLWIVPKKPDSKGNKRWRMVIDYRSLNEKTIGDAYPFPNITDILDQLGSAKYFSTFDLASGFHQIPRDTTDAQKTAFSTPHITILHVCRSDSKMPQLLFNA